MDTSSRTQWVVERARALGFDLCGVAPAEDFPELARLPEWLARGYAGEMRYLHDARRQTPARVLEGARSLIVCALNYNTALPYSTEVPPSASSAPSAVRTRGWISRYAWCDDYHDVLGEKLEALVLAMREQFPEPFDARAYVDTGPVVERVAAKHAGLGWLAKNTCLISEKLGSWLFLGVIVTTLELAPSLGAAEAPPPDLCGNCTLCIEACPTGAIVEPYLLDARRCISYLTIELRGPIPEEFRAAVGRQVFGCDICQDVCPWNRRAPVTSLPQFQPRVVATENGKGKIEKGAGAPLVHPEPPTAGRRAALETREDAAPALPESVSSVKSVDEDSLFAPSLEWLASLTEEQFREVFRGSAIKRTKWQGLVRNASLALGNKLVGAGFKPAPPNDVPHAPRANDSRALALALLERLAQSDDAVIADAARWALNRLR